MAPRVYLNIEYEDGDEVLLYSIKNRSAKEVIEKDDYFIAIQEANRSFFHTLILE